MTNGPFSTASAPTSAISPGLSWYEDTLDNRPAYPQLAESQTWDVAIIGGGFTGLSAAYHLARGGAHVVVLDGARFGDGASGRNGGQLGTGQRQWVDDLEKTYGFEQTKALFDLAEKAKTYLFNLAKQEGFDFDYQPGHLSVVHRQRLLNAYRHHIDTMARYGYDKLRFIDQTETAARLGSNYYWGGISDSGTGHVNPLKLVVGLAQAADRAGAQLYENSRVDKLEKKSGQYQLTTARGVVYAQRVLVATNAYGLGLDNNSQKYVVPIRSYIAATAPLAPNSTVLPKQESVDDSRFVVRYFRKVKDGRLLFGGAESYAGTTLPNIKGAVQQQLYQVYPALKNIPLTHGWGGSVAITVERMPYIRDVMPGVTYCGGYSGHGVMLAPYFGKLYADALLNNSNALARLKHLKISRFPGGHLLRRPVLFLAMQMFALLDRL